MAEHEGLTPEEVTQQIVVMEGAFMHPYTEDDDSMRSAHHPAEAAPEYTTPGLLVKDAISAAKKGKWYQRSAARDMEEPFSEAPPNEFELPPDSQDVPPTEEPRLRLVRPHLHRPYKKENTGGHFPSGSVQPSFGHDDSREESSNKSLRLTVRKFIAGLAVVALVVGVAYGGTEFIDNHSQTENDRPEQLGAADRARVMTELLGDVQALEVTKSCAPELTAQEEWAGYLERKWSTYKGPSPRAYVRAANAADVHHIGCTLPKGANGRYSRLVNGIPVTIVPADITSFEISQVCQDLRDGRKAERESLPGVGTDLLHRINEIRADLIADQHLTCG